MKRERAGLATDPFTGPGPPSTNGRLNVAISRRLTCGLNASQLALRSHVRRMSIMQCDICGEELDNSEDLAKHTEKMHAIGEIEDTENPEEKAAKLAEEEEVPEPAPIPGRM
jgi:hypothetical protein